MIEACYYLPCYNIKRISSNSTIETNSKQDNTKESFMEPLSIAVISGAAGGVAGVFSKEVWDLGKNWINSYFKDHAPKAIAKAEQNSLDFLVQLAQRVKTLEEQGEQHREIITESLNQPDFSALLQKAWMSSAQTEDKQKHELLARLVADRLTKETESMFALASRQACDAVSMLTINQMKILGLLIFKDRVQQSPFPPVNMSQEEFNKWYVEYLTDNMQLYQDLTISRLDMVHLGALSCISILGISVRDHLRHILWPKKERGVTFGIKLFTSTELGKKMEELWESHLNGVSPTSIGELIGIYVSDMLRNTTTSLEGWGESNHITVTLDT